MAIKSDKRRSVKLTEDNTLALLIKQGQNEFYRSMSIDQIANSLIRIGLRAAKNSQTKTKTK